MARPIWATSSSCTTAWCGSYALACDIVLAARGATFIQAFVKIGLVPDSGASCFLPRLVGEALIAHLARQPTEALAMMKRMFAASATDTLDAQLDLERDCQLAAGRSADYAEGVRAFLDKRAPAFRGRA